MRGKQMRSAILDLVDRGGNRFALGSGHGDGRSWWRVRGWWLAPFWLRRLHQLGAHGGWMVPFHRKSDARATGERPIVLVRVADYPRWDRPLNEFLAFDALLRRYGVPYAVGVTPFLSIPPRPGQLESAEIETMRQLVDRSVTVALHGFTHLPHRWGRRCTVELPAYSPQQLREWIDRS